MDAVNDVESIVQRTIRSIAAIAQRVTRFATLLLLVAATIVIGSFLLGLAALSDGIRTVWAVLGIVFGALAIGAALMGRWGVGRIRKDVPAIATEVRALIQDGRQPGHVIIQEFESDDVETVSGSAIVVSRRMSGLRGVAGQGLEGATRLTLAVRAITRFPLLALMTILITLVFGFLALVFLLALAL